LATSIAEMAPGVVRRPLKRLFRGVGVATSDLRPLPDFLIIGTHRGGTTSLHGYLEQHPCVARKFPRVQHLKGVRYFDENFFRGIEWYRSHFATAAYRNALRRLHGGPIVSGDASSYYLFHPAAAERAAGVVPHAKIIVLLRDPIDRAYSHWKRERRDGTEPLERFEDAVAAEPERLAGEEERILGDERYYSYAHENFSYISQGLYVDALRRWLEHYPREQVYVEASERLLRDPQRAYDGVLRFLGLPPFSLRDARRLNTTASGQGLAPTTRRELIARVAPYNRQLEALLGIRLGWDDGAGTEPMHPNEGWSVVAPTGSR
jgi:Sulfotransferase domain